MNAMLLVFVLIEFVPGSSRLYLDLMFLCFFTWHTVTYEYLRYVADQQCSAFAGLHRPVYRTLVWCTVFVFWAFWLVETVGGPSLIGASRPIILVTKSRGYL